MADKRSEHVVIEMAEITPTAGKDEVSDATHEKPPKVPWTTSTVQSRTQRDEEFDQDMLRRAIADTGRWAYGTISVEAWVHDEQTGKLVRPKRAFWFDPIAVRAGAGNEAMMRLVDDKREDFVRPDPLAPGIGLAGALWSELSSHNKRITMPSGRPSIINGRPSMTSTRGIAYENIAIPKRVVWREVEPISNDPNQPYNLRLQLAVQAGIGLAAGVQFQFRGTHGLVIYMARGKTDLDKLKSPTNEQYLLSAADVIGSIVSLRGPRHVHLTERRAERDVVRRRVRNKIVAFVRLGGSFLRDMDESDGKPTSVDKPSGKSETSISGSMQKNEVPPRTFFESKLMLAVRKWKGANNEPPPPFTTRESIFTFFGCFLSLLMLLYFSDAITKRNPEYGLVLGPFGALVTLQYSLTAAPASQPRNAILGQAISLSIALGMTYTSLATNVRKALATALAIMCMARLGVTHPPAGAAALLFAGGKYSWGHMGIMLAGNILAILSATVINDMNVKRQYPTFWGFGYWRKLFFGGNTKRKSA